MSSLLVTTGSLDNAIPVFSLAQRTWNIRYDTLNAWQIVAIINRLLVFFLKHETSNILLILVIFDKTILLLFPLAFIAWI